MRRLTDIWTDLVGGIERSQNEVLRERDRLDRVERVSGAFSNFYWTRLVAVHRDQAEELQRHEMVADIVEAWNEVEEAGELLSLDFKIHFDPRHFVEEHPAPTLQEFRMDTDVLREWGEKCSRLRVEFMERVRGLSSPAEDLMEQAEGLRSRKGLKLSQPSSNPEGLAEWKMRERSLRETPPGRQYCARRRKQLSLEEQEAIVKMYETTG